MKPLNTTDYSILGFLTLRPMSGYDIKNFLDMSLSFFWKGHFSSIYPSLKKLESFGYAVKSDDTEESGPKRYIYTVTDDGRKAFNQWVVLPMEFEHVRISMLLKLFFTNTDNKEAMTENILTMAEEYQKRIEEISEVARVVTEQLGEHPGYPYWMMTIDFGIKSYTVSIEWCKETAEKIKKME